MKRNLIIITGQEGAGKSTIIRALLPHTNDAAQIDAEDIGQTNPWKMNEDFMNLLWNNVNSLMNNFWNAGYSTIIAASFLNTYPEYKLFKKFIPKDTNVFVIQLSASQNTRNSRRKSRSKPTTEEWRKIADTKSPEDKTLEEANDTYKFLRIENNDESVEVTVQRIKEKLPEIYE